MKGQKLVELFNIEFSPDKSLYKQLYQFIIQQIKQKQLRAGDRLPASRKLAKQLNISRNTVQRAYDQLLVEGYLIAKAGSGVFVQADIPDDYCSVEQAVCINPSPKSKIHFNSHSPLGESQNL